MKNTILIPYRNRPAQLTYFLNNSYPLLKKNLEELEILVIEQVEGKQFNRGKILNIGFNESESDYYFTHDVDINPLEEIIKTLYNKEVLCNDIMGIYTSPWTLGGIIKFRSSTYENINGFPNNFWGWGSEDKDLQNRAEFKSINVVKNILNMGPEKDQYFKIFDTYVRDKSNLKIHHKFVYDLWKNTSIEDKKKYIENNGLSTLNYKIIKEEILMDNVKKITVDI